jgi:hypothetical protein
VVCAHSAGGMGPHGFSLLLEYACDAGPSPNTSSNTPTPLSLAAAFAAAAPGGPALRFERRLPLAVEWAVQPGLRVLSASLQAVSFVLDASNTTTTTTTTTTCVPPPARPSTTPTSTAATPSVSPSVSSQSNAALLPVRVPPPHTHACGRVSRGWDAVICPASPLARGVCLGWRANTRPAGYTPAVGYHTAMKKLRIAILRFGTARQTRVLNDGRIQNPSNPFGIVPLSNFVSRGFGFVHHSIAILYHEVPNPNITIRNFLIAVYHQLSRGRSTDLRSEPLTRARFAGRRVRRGVPLPAGRGGA